MRARLAAQPIESVPSRYLNCQAMLGMSQFGRASLTVARSRSATHPTWSLYYRDGTQNLD